MIFVITCLSLLLGTTSAFQLQFPPKERTSLASYLDSLASAQPTSPAPAAAPVAAAPNSPVPFTHATADFFALEQLAGKGPRPTFDWGAPADASRKLCDDGVFRAGSWFCSEGGWPSPNPKGATEIFYVIEGFGILGDADGAKHYFGPGDTVTIPKGHTGRWDVLQDIHKVWAVNAHDQIEESSTPIRVQVDHYHEFAPHHLSPNSGSDPLYRSDSPLISSRTMYDVGPTKLGAWTAEPGTIEVVNGVRSFVYMLEGVVVITDSSTGESRRCVAGDTVMLPEGWYGYIDVIEPAKKLWTTAA